MSDALTLRRAHPEHQTGAARGLDAVSPEVLNTGRTRMAKVKLVNPNA